MTSWDSVWLHPGAGRGCRLACADRGRLAGQRPGVGGSVPARSTGQLGSRRRRPA